MSIPILRFKGFLYFFIFLGCSVIGKPPFLSLTFEKPRLASEASHT